MMMILFAGDDLF